MTGMKNKQEYEEELRMGKGGFTLPGESGYEELTLKMAEKWGADVIRDSDGTVLSDEITHAGYGIYSTICIIRDHNAWAKENQDKLQQTFLCTPPQVAESDTLTIGLMDSFFAEQFRINDSAESLEYWEIYDRTTNVKIDNADWSYDKEKGSVSLSGIIPFHKYTVSFLAYRIWEEISMYNHTTNHWDKEHLMQIDPRYPETQEYLLGWMKHWCETHPDTTVVRFTSMFYNFVWIWGSSERNRNLFSDWGSYDFTVSVPALQEFEKQYGYRMTAEDFINKGQLHVTHMPGNAKKADWMAFINDFVISFGRKLIDMVHSYGKKAYVFYDDSWVGVEPYNGRFQEFGFDGLIKCVFSGYEARLCAGVDVPTHELRLHPYLFPVGLGGAPTFMEGGNPTLDAKKYWNSVRRALLRAKIDRIGLGGYLHLVEGFPDFCDYIEKVADEFRLIRSFHDAGEPYRIKTRVAVLHYWGSLRSWTLSGHFHETYMHDLIHINEALSGLPVDVKFISFDDILKDKDILKDIDVIINVGDGDTAHTGGAVWENAVISAAIREFVYQGGGFIGVGEPAGHQYQGHYLQLADLIGVEKETGFTLNYDKYNWEEHKNHFILADTTKSVDFGEGKKNMFAYEGTEILVQRDKEVQMAVHEFGEGRSVYISGLPYSFENSRILYRSILWSTHGENLLHQWFSTNFNVEVHAYVKNGKFCVVNNTYEPQDTVIYRGDGSSFALKMEANEIKWYTV